MDDASGAGERGNTDVHAADGRALVAVMNSTRDFEIARVQGWYRIPLRRAPPQIGADYLAFYHTAVFAEEKWTIRYYASVRGYRIVTRAELLPDDAQHPRALDRYYRIDIGPLVALPAPIPSRKLRRVTFIPTTLGRLLEAEELTDLWSRDSAEEQLWSTFCGAQKIKSGRYYRVREDQRPYETSAGAWSDRARDVGWLVDRGRVMRVPTWLLSYFSLCPPCDGSPTCLAMVRAEIALRTAGGAEGAR